MPEDSQKPRYGMVLAVYLTGLLVGGLYVGMVIPARTVVQASLGIDSSTGIWMINIYTLFYAALIPTIGKLADMHGRRKVFVICVGIFGIGSFVCAFSEQFGGFALLLIGRVLQAAGAGGIIPVANAEIGTSFPKEKRGMALGMAAAVTGISNVLGAVVGSAILGIAGQDHWSALFFVAIPFCVLLIVCAVLFLPNQVVAKRGRLDIIGSFFLTIFVLALLLGIKELDFFDLLGTLTKPMTWVFLIVALVSIILFARVEYHAKDPLFNMGYIANRQIRIILAVSFFIGCSIISMTVVPEFAEYTMGLQPGDGGYYVAAIGVFSIAGPPLAGKLIDRFGAKPVLLFGLVVMVAGYLFLAFFVASNATVVSMVVGLAIVGFGMGFAMGAPTNYMILENTDSSESTSAIATITLIRQIGTSVAPAILVGFISQGTGLFGFQQMLIAVAVFNICSIVLTLFYQE